MNQHRDDLIMVINISSFAFYRSTRYRLFITDIASHNWYVATRLRVE